VCTGCGPGRHEGPDEGRGPSVTPSSAIEHGRCIGITEPGIIAAEPPNPIVTQLAIMPDIEKRLEAFVRLAHGIVVFPGGAGTGGRDPLPDGNPAGSRQPRAAVSHRADRAARTAPRISEAHHPLHLRHLRGRGGAAAESPSR